MDEATYLRIAEKTFRAIEAALDAADAEDIDCEQAGDVMTLTFKDGRRCVLNTQRPTRQLWLAADARAWHFGYDDKTGRWVDDKRPEVELFAMMAKIIRDHSAVDVRFSQPAS